LKIARRRTKERKNAVIPAAMGTLALKHDEGDEALPLLTAYRKALE